MSAPKILKTKTLAAIEPRVVPSPRVTQAKLGIAWDRPTAQVLNAIIRDVMAYQAAVDQYAEVLIVTEDPEFLSSLGAIHGVKVTGDPILVARCKVWKLYIEKEMPAVPAENPTQVYYRQVGELEADPLILRQGQPGYPSLFNPADNREVPIGRGLNVNKIPPRYFTQMPYTIQQPWW